MKINFKQIIIILFVFFLVITNVSCGKSTPKTGHKQPGYSDENSVVSDDLEQLTMSYVDDVKKSEMAK